MNNQLQVLKIMKLLIATIFSIVLSANLSGQINRNVKLQTIEHSPIIDGQLDDACWQKAKWNKGLLALNRQGNAATDTEFAVLYKNNILYIGGICREKKGEKIISRKRTRDGSVYSDDCVEFMLLPCKDLPPDEKLIEYMHFAVNSASQKYDALRSCGIANKKWNASWKAKTKIYKNKWTIEIAINCASLKLKSHDPSWRFNFCRSKPGHKYASWAKVNSYHQKKNYPLLENIPKELYKNCVQISKISFVQKNGNVNLKTDITNNGTYSGKATLDIITISPDKIPQKYSTDFKTIPEKQSSISLPVKVKKSGVYRVRGIIRDNKGKIFRIISRKVSISISPLKIKIIAPCYRNNIYSTQKLANIEALAQIECRTNSTSKLFAELTAVNSGKVISSVCRLLNKQRKIKISIPAQGLAIGTYKLNISLISKGKKLAKSNHIIKVLPKAPGAEVRIDKDLNIVVNGVKFFPWGFMGARANKHTYLKNAGFNTIQSYAFELKNIESARKSLDLWHKSGIKVILYPYYKTFFRAGHFIGPSAPGISPNELEQLKKRVKALMSHPAILGWYLCDEPRGPKKIHALEQIYKLLREIDPYHPCFVLNNSAEGCLDIKNTGDVFYPDVYPNFKKKGNSVAPLSLVSNSVNAIYRGSNYSKPVIFCAQTFDYGAYRSPELYRAPTYEEVRCMIYLALVSNAKGIVSFKIGDSNWRERGWPAKSAGIYATSSLGTGLLEGLGKEIEYLGNVFTASKANLNIKVNNKDILYQAKRTESGKLFIICVNKTAKTIKADISIQGFKKKKLNVFPENRSILVKNAGFKDKFEPYEVHIYTTDFNMPQIKTIADVQKLISKKIR
jgi:hypothetical protein